MNWQHLILILWLRSRLSYNQWRRAGVLNAVLTTALVIGALVTAVIAFFVALIVGCVMLPKAEPDDMMLVWDLIVVSFLFMWSMGVVTELQRTELLSLEKMLHFPISPTGAFLLNYLSSMVSIAIILFLPAMLGLSIASVVTHGAAMLLLFPLIFGVVMLTTAVTYQFRGWMANLMRDKRRRRTILAAVTVGFILMTQLPNLAHLAFQQHRRAHRETDDAARAELSRQLEEGEIEHSEFALRLEKLLDELVAKKEREKDERWVLITDTLTIVNLAVPLGWLPYGVRAASVGNLWPGLLGSLGMMLLGGASLWGSHRATMRFYTGQINATKPRRSVRQTVARIESAPFLERTLPGCSERVSVAALASLQNMIRAPEAKMALLSPLIMAVIFGGMIFMGPLKELPVEANPFLAVCAIAMSMFGMMQVLVNVFGSDRGGFRAFVLMPVARRDILLAKNLAFGSFAIAVSTITVLAVQLVLPMSLMHFVATLVQLVPVYLLVCLLGNMTSIFAPLAVAAGSLKPVQPKFWPIFLQMMVMMALPLVLIPALAALSCELLLDKFAGGRWFPLFLLVSLVELPIALFLYPRLLTLQGQLLQQRESKILEVVTAHPE